MMKDSLFMWGILFIGVILVNGDARCGDMSNEELSAAVTLTVRGHRLETWTQDIETRFVNVTNTMLMAGRSAAFRAGTNVGYKRNSQSSTDLTLVLFTRLEPNRGHLSSLQLATEYTTGYLTLVRDADVYYYPNQVEIGPTSDCRVGVTRAPDTSTGTDDDDDELNWDILKPWIVIALVLIAVSVCVVVAVKNKRSKRRQLLMQTLQIKAIEQTIVSSNSALMNASFNSAAQLTMMGGGMGPGTPHIVVVDDIQTGTSSDFHQTTLHTKL